MKTLKNKNIIITGGGRGIGAEASKLLASEGANVVLTCRTNKEGLSVEKDILKNVNLSNKDVSLEISSKYLRDNFPDPYERAKVIFEQCKRFSV